VGLLGDNDKNIKEIIFMKQKVIISTNDNVNNFEMCYSMASNGDVVIYYEKSNTPQTTDYLNTNKKIVITHYYKNLVNISIDKISLDKKVLFADLANYKFDNFDEFNKFINKFNVLSFKYNVLQSYTNKNKIFILFNKLSRNKTNNELIHRELYNDATFKQFYDFIQYNKEKFELNDDIINSFALYIYYNKYYQNNMSWVVS
jgi:hypothetical protein